MRRPTRRLPTVLIDTREKLPFKFPGRRVKRTKLTAGDYTNTAGGPLVERKSMNDLFGCLTANRELFQDQLQRLGKSGPFKALLIIEGTPHDVMKGSTRTTAFGPRMFERLLGLCFAAGVCPIFTKDRKDAEETTRRLV